MKVSKLSRQLEEQRHRGARLWSQLRARLRGAGAPHTLTLSFTLGLLMGLHSHPGRKPAKGPLLRWSKTVLVFTRLGRRWRRLTG